jgi:hypothetical protein
MFSLSPGENWNRLLQERCIWQPGSRLHEVSVYSVSWVLDITQLIQSEYKVFVAKYNLCIRHPGRHIKPRDTLYDVLVAR